MIPRQDINPVWDTGGGFKAAITESLCRKAASWLSLDICKLLSYSSPKIDRRKRVIVGVLFDSLQSVCTFFLWKCNNRIVYCVCMWPAAPCFAARNKEPHLLFSNQLGRPQPQKDHSPVQPQRGESEHTLASMWHVHLLNHTGKRIINIYLSKSINYTV